MKKRKVTDKMRLDWLDKTKKYPIYIGPLGWVASNGECWSQIRFAIDVSMNAAMRGRGK